MRFRHIKKSWLSPKTGHPLQSAYYWNESKTYWFGPKKFFVASRSFPFWPKNSGTKQTIFILSGNCLRQSRTFLFNPKTNRAKQKVLIWFAYYQNKSKIFWFGLLIIGTKAKHFDLVCLLSEQKQNILIWSAYYRNKSKTFWFGLLIIGNKSKSFWFGLLIIGTKAKQFDLLLKLSHL